MENVIELKKGAVYFRALFYDAEMNVPSIETYIYEGLDKDHGHLFVSAAGFSSTRNNQDQESHYISYSKKEITSIYDLENLILWLQETHSQQTIARTFSYVEA